MTPLVLELEGFTCYRGRTKITWEEADAPLFAITGPTGAGKSTILDAITFVLYGKTPRLGGRGMSTLISPGRESLYVQLEFRTGRGVYRVTRALTRRGDASQTEVRVDKLEGGEFRQLSSSERVKDANEALEEIVGLDYEGFTRAVLLPQGAFDEFLRGDARLRRQLLSTLLGLERVEQIQKRAAATASSLKERAGTLRSLLEGEYVGVTPAAVTEQKERLKEREAAVTVLKGQLKEVEAALSTQTRVKDLLGEYVALKERAAELAAAEPEMQRKKSALEESHKAGTVLPVAQLVKRAGKRLTEAKEAVTARSAELKSAEEALARAAAQADEQVASGQERLAALESKLRVLEGAAPEISRLEARGGSLKDAAHAAVGELLSESAWGSLQVTLSLIPSLARAVKAQHETRSKLSQEQQSKATLKATLRELTAELAALTARGRELRKAKVAADEALELATQADIAATLRAQLTAGERCPVCGGTIGDHQHAVSSEALTAATARVEAAGKALDGALEEHRALTGRVAEAEARLEAAGERATTAEGAVVEADATANSVAAQLSAQGLGQGLTLASTAGGEPQSQSAVGELEGRLRAASKDLLAKHALAVTSSLDDAGVKAVGESDLQAQLTEIRSAVGEARRRAEAAEREAKELEARVRASEASLQAAREHAERYEADYQEAEADLRRAVEAAGFPDAAAAEAATLSDSERNAHERALSEHQSERARIEAREGTIRDELATVGVPLLPEAPAQYGEAVQRVGEMSAEAAQLREEERAAQESLGGARQELAWLVERLERSVAFRRELRELEDQHDLYHQLNLDLRGNRFPEHLLTQVQQLLARRASAILRHVTDGRYDLLLHDGDYLVSDAWAGGELRSARTLSGGESFVASLALALALSDTLAGNAALGALFLDEGFGALDRETLDAVSSVLESLTDGGRMVGVITHVTELSERLPARLLVSKGPGGSSVAWDA